MKYGIVLMIVLFSCNLTEQKFRSGSVEVMENSYKKNKVKFILTKSIVDGKLYTWDTTFLDQNANVIKSRGYKGNYEYDSIGRTTTYSFKSCTWAEYRIFYKQLPEERKIVQSWYDVTDKDSTLSFQYVFNFNLTLDTIVSESFLRHGKEVWITKYSYKNGKLMEISPDMEGFRTKFIYNKSGQLEKAFEYIYDKPYQVHFISVETGLIDSSLSLSLIPDFILDETTDLQGLKYDPEEMHYYTYFK